MALLLFCAFMFDWLLPLKAPVSVRKLLLKKQAWNSTYRSEVLVYPATNKRAHAVTWASTYYLVAKENYQFSDRDFKRMLQNNFMKYRKLLFCF